MSVCEHCKYRYSWDCEECWLKGGCDDFFLDFETLTRRQKKVIRKILQHEEYGE